MDLGFYFLHDYITSWLYIIIGCLGILLNVTALIVLFKVKKGVLGLHLLLLKSLAISDLLVCLLGVLKVSVAKMVFIDISIHILTVLKQCKFAYIATFLNLVLIAVNQYIAVTKPLRYNQLVTRRRMVAALSIIWILAILLSCIDLLQALTQRSDSFRSLYDLLSEIKIHSKFTMVVWKLFTAIIFIGSIVLCVLYIKIYQAARRNLRQTDALNQVQIQKHKERRHSVNTSLLLLGTFLLVYVPFCAAYTSKEYLESTHLKNSVEHYSKQWTELLRRITIILFYMEPILLVNSVSDPLIYMLRLGTIKQTIKKMMCRSCRSSAQSESGNTSHHGQRHVYCETQL